MGDEKEQNEKRVGVNENVSVYIPGFIYSSGTEKTGVVCPEAVEIQGNLRVITCGNSRVCECMCGRRREKESVCVRGLGRV